MDDNNVSESIQAAAKESTLQDIQNKTFDHIIIGGGNSGCLLASRLASSSQVLLVEAGGHTKEDPDNLIPGLVVPKFGSEAGNWQYSTIPQHELNDRKILYPRGKGMGGSSTVNFSAWVRGPKCDWDAWAEMVGDEWWRWENVVDEMRKLEDFEDGVPDGMGGGRYVRAAEGVHGKGGPIGVGWGAEWQNVVEYCMEGCREAGTDVNLDHNDGEVLGVSVAQMNVERGVRRNAADAYLGEEETERLGERLVVVTRTICAKVKFEGKRAVGVELLPSNPGAGQEDEPVRVHAAKEVVLCAGAFATPQLLLLSGVGPSDELSRHNIPTIHDAPNVGKNIRDHAACSIEAIIDSDISGHNQLLRNPEALAAAHKQYASNKTGPLAVFGASAAVCFPRLDSLYTSPEFQSLPKPQQAFLSHPTRPSTELWLHGGPLFYTGPINPEDSVLAVEGLVQNLLSRGSLTLQSNSPRDLPVIDMAYCTEPYDWRVAIETVKFQLKVVQTKAIQDIVRKVLYGPGKREADGSVTLCSPDDEDAIREFLRNEMTQGFHSLGSCAMGRTTNGERVVDADFRVVGLEGLRIADMSVCPILTNNHTQINAYLIAERCAQLILEEQQG